MRMCNVQAGQLRLIIKEEEIGEATLQNIIHEWCYSDWVVHIVRENERYEVSNRIGGEGRAWCHRKLHKHRWRVNELNWIAEQQCFLMYIMCRCRGEVSAFGLTQCN